MSSGSLGESALGDDGFFIHHGIWAPGVRLFRRLDFTVKALIVSICFMVPLSALLVAYLGQAAASLTLTRQELSGLEMLRAMEPWAIEVQKQRRLVLSGLADRPDLDAIGKASDKARVLIRAKREGVDADAALAAAERCQDELKDAVARDHGPALQAPLEKCVDALLGLRGKVLDASQLSLDPEQATYYLMLASTSQMSEALESISLGRGLAHVVGQGGARPADLLRLHDAWHDGQQALAGLEDSMSRAEQMVPGLTRTVGLETVRSAMKTYADAAAASWFGEHFDANVAGLAAPGQQAVDALRKFSLAAMDELGRLLGEREAQMVRGRQITLAVVVVSLLTAAYLFHSFYLVMHGGLNEVARHLQAMTDGDLTTFPRPWGRDEAAQLMTCVGTMQGSVRGIVAEVRSAAQQLVQASAEIAGASTDLSQRSEQAAANLQESASAMEQISSTVDQAASSTKVVSELAAENATMAEQGGRSIAAVVQTMQGVQSSSARISEIITVIDGIAFQTNILALNASVEAARAGEHGRGFNVVAGEVRALAQRSAVAAREIKTLINDSVGRIEQGSNGVRDAGGRMAELVGRAERMKLLMAEIYSGTQEQSAGIRQVGGSIQSLDQQTQQNAALVEQTAAAAASLRDQANHLAQHVARFRLPPQALA